MYVYMHAYDIRIATFTSMRTNASVRSKWYTRACVCVFMRTGVCVCSCAQACVCVDATSAMFDAWVRLMWPPRRTHIDSDR